MKKLIAILTVIMIVGVIGYLSAGPLPFSSVSETIAGYLSTLTSNAQDQIDAKAATTVVTDTLGAPYDSLAELKKLMSVSQSVSVANAAALTPTPGYKWLDVSLNCEDATTSIGTGGVTLVETGMITDAYIKISNTSTGADDGNVCTFAYVAGNVEWPGGAGLTISMKDGESMLLHWEADRYKVIVNNTSTQWVSGIASKTPVTDDADDFEDAGIFGDSGNSNMYGGTFVANATGTILLATPVAGMNFTVIVATPVAVIIDPQVGDAMMTDGVLGAAGENITSLSAAGDIAFVQYYSANTWLVTTNGWTPE